MLEQELYGDIVFKFKRIVDDIDLSEQVGMVVSHYLKIF